MTPEWNSGDIDKWNRKWLKRYWLGSTEGLAIIILVALFLIINIIACT